jgi:uncharacterized protein (DUF1810 family)
MGFLVTRQSWFDSAAARARGSLIYLQPTSNMHGNSSIPLSVTAMDDPYHLQRFVDAQRGIYAQVEAELRFGRKQSHWMWFIFPQIKGLGQSTMARKYAIATLTEATAYLNHSLLGQRLHACTELVNSPNHRVIEDVFGYPDHLKFHSSMTLFAHAAGDNRVFKDALRRYFRSEFDPQTIERL